MSDKTKTKKKTETETKTKTEKKGQCPDCARRSSGVSRDSRGRPHTFYDPHRHEGSDM